MRNFARPEGLATKQHGHVDSLQIRKVAHQSVKGEEDGESDSNLSLIRDVFSLPTAKKSLNAKSEVKNEIIQCCNYEDHERHCSHTCTQAFFLCWSAATSS